MTLVFKNIVYSRREYAQLLECDGWCWYEGEIRGDDATLMTYM